MTSKYYFLLNQIKENNKLKHLLIYDNFDYMCYNYVYSKGFTHLHKCVMRTNEFPFLNKYINEFLKLYPKVINRKNQRGFTALMLAAINSNDKSTEKTVKILLKHKAKIDLQHEYGWTALMCTAFYSRTLSSEKTVKLLLKHGANVNIRDKNGFTALILATCQSGQHSTENTVRMLLKYGADINMQSNDGETALMCPINDSDTSTQQTIKILLDHNPNVNMQDRKGKTALMHIFEKQMDDKIDMVRLLLKHNADIHIKNRNDEDVISIAFDDENLNRNIINILLPNRTAFVGAVKYKKIVNITKVEFGDFKINCGRIDNFHDIIVNM